MIRLVLLSTLLSLSLVACKKQEAAAPAAAPQGPVVGLVTDVGGRGDGSFNDSALRGLEWWAAGTRWVNGRYQPLPPAELGGSLAADLKERIQPVGIKPLVVQSKAQEDYEPNLQLLVEQGAELIVGVGFMLENSVEAVAKRNPDSRFLLIDSPVLDPKGSPVQLPNVRTVVFKEEEGSFLVGALAGLVAQKQIGFVGGMEIPLIKKFEVGFRAGVQTTQPELGQTLLATYTGTFDNVAAGKQVAQDMLSKGVDVIFHAAGSDGLGVIQAVKEARAAGKKVYAIGVDSDQHHLAPEAMLTSMVKRVDLAVYQAAKDLVENKLTAGDVVLGLKEGGVTLAEVRLDFPGKADALAQVEALRQKIIAAEIRVPSDASALEAFKAQP